MGSYPVVYELEVLGGALIYAAAFPHPPGIEDLGPGGQEWLDAVSRIQGLLSFFRKIVHTAALTHTFVAKGDQTRGRSPWQ